MSRCRPHVTHKQSYGERVNATTKRTSERGKKLFGSMNAMRRWCCCCCSCALLSIFCTTMSCPLGHRFPPLPLRPLAFGPTPFAPTCSLSHLPDRSLARQLFCSNTTRPRCPVKFTTATATTTKRQSLPRPPTSSYAASTTTNADNMLSWVGGAHDRLPL